MEEPKSEIIEDAKEEDQEVVEHMLIIPPLALNALNESTKSPDKIVIDPIQSPR